MYSQGLDQSYGYHYSTICSEGGEHVDDHIDFISCNSNCSYTNANTIPHYNDSSAMNSKLSYQAINRKSHKTLNTLFGIPVTITHNYSYTYSNIAFLDGDGCCTYPKDILIGCDILTKIPLLLDYSAQTAYLKDKDTEPISENKSQNTESSDYFSNAKLRSLQNELHDLKTLLLNLKLFKTLLILKLILILKLLLIPILILHKLFLIFKTHLILQLLLSLSHSSQTIPYSQTSPNFHSHSPQTSSPHILKNITPHNSPLRHNNSPSNSSPSPMIKDNRQTDPSYKPYPLYKNSQNISQMRLRIK
ncbi:hypothetical protein Avbf_13618 [Armadillidium vulgare]|nr:hypothetical protein Avbf_13618 [Armadillidium vulgare]